MDSNNYAGKAFMTGVDVDTYKSNQILIGLSNNKYEFEDDLAYMTH
jgi:hypothetical protein